MSTPPVLAAQDIAAFLGQGDDDTVLALAEQALPVIRAMAFAYTRGRGFVDNDAMHPNLEVAAVITTATARLMSNPEQLKYRVGDVSYQSAFEGWTLAETFVLNRYRKKAIG